MHLPCVDVVNTSRLPGFGAGAATTELFGAVEMCAGVILSPRGWVWTIGPTALRRERNTLCWVWEEL